MSDEAPQQPGLEISLIDQVGALVSSWSKDPV